MHSADEIIPLKPASALQYLWNAFPLAAEISSFSLSESITKLFFR
jgi:hypothetical protein